MSVVDIPAFLLDLLQSVGAAMPLQHSGEADCDCLSGMFPQVGKELWKSPLLPSHVGCRLLGLPPVTEAQGRALGSSWAASHCAFPKGWVWPGLAWGQRVLRATLETSQPLMGNVIEKLCSLHNVKRIRNHRDAYWTCLPAAGSLRCPMLASCPALG